VDEIIEVALPFAAFGCGSGHRVILHAELHRDGAAVERLPGAETIRFAAPTVDFEATRWQV